MSKRPLYEFDYVTTSEDAVPLGGSAYWYETGESENAEMVYHDTSDTYAYWYNGADWLISAVGDVGGTPADYFLDATGTLTGQGAWVGTLTIKTTTIGAAWRLAETTAFESFRAFVGAQEGRDCFRGFLPVQGDTEEDLYINVWEFTSGNSGEFEMNRVWGEDPNWCSLRADARIESMWETREKAMLFAGCVMAWLKSTNNLQETGNVTWCTLAEVPAEPEIYRTNGRMNRERYWRQTVDLELVYKTENLYD